MSLSAVIRRFLGLAPARATLADQSAAEADNALKEVVDATTDNKRTNIVLTEAHKELRKTVSSLEPFVQIENLMREDHRRNGVRIR